MKVGAVLAEATETGLSRRSRRRYALPGILTLSFSVYNILTETGRSAVAAVGHLNRLVEEVQRYRISLHESADQGDRGSQPL